MGAWGPRAGLSGPLDLGSGTGPTHARHARRTRHARKAPGRDVPVGTGFHPDDLSHSTYDTVKSKNGILHYEKLFLRIHIEKIFPQ